MVATVVEVLDGYEPTLFSRISLYLLRLFPEPVLVEQRLTSSETFSEPDLNREYSALLQQEYCRLSESAREAILRFIDAGARPFRVGRSYRAVATPSDGEARR